MKQAFLWILTGFLALTGFAAGQSPEMQNFDLSQISRWRPNNTFSKVEGTVLTTEVPEGSHTAQNWMEYEIDLTPYRSNVLTLAVKYRSFQVSRPPEDYNGIKFMLKFRPTPESSFTYPAVVQLYGTSDG